MANVTPSPTYTKYRVFTIKYEGNNIEVGQNEVLIQHIL